MHSILRGSWAGFDKSFLEDMVSMRCWIQHLGQICRMPSVARLVGMCGVDAMIDAFQSQCIACVSIYTSPSTSNRQPHFSSTFSPLLSLPVRFSRAPRLHRLYVQNPSQDPATPPTQFRKSGSARPPAYIKVWPFISLSRSLPSQFKDGRQDDLSQDDYRLPRLQGEGGQCTRLERVSAGWEGGGGGEKVGE